MANQSLKLIDLVKKELKKTDDEKQFDSLVEKVEDNKLEFINYIHNLKKRINLAKIKVENDEKDVNATPSGIANNIITLKSLEKELEILEIVKGYRF